MKVTRSTTLTCLLALVSACSASPPPPAEPPAAATPVASEPRSASGATKTAAGIAKSDYGQVDGKTVQLYTLTNANGSMLKVTNYGTIITELHVPDRDGKLADIVLGYENLDGYVAATPYFGATVGRIANRIKDAKFSLRGKTYELAANNGPHSLHGGVKGWDKVVWDAEEVNAPNGPTLLFTYVSKDGEEGFPGTVTAKVRYTFTNADELEVEMTATTDATTIVNMAHHTYWNLGGHDSGSIVDQELTIYADTYTPSAPVKNGDPVPDGSVEAVKGTPFDFTVAKTIGKDLQASGGNPIGFDHNWVVNGTPGSMRPAARVKDPKSGRVLLVETTDPGVQFYSGKFLDGSITGKGATYQQYDGFCIETQRFPNAINVPAWKQQVILEPGETYSHSMIHRLTVE